MQRTAHGLTLALSAAFLLTACAEGGAPSTPEPPAPPPAPAPIDPTIVGATGGTVPLSGGDVQVVVPAGALTGTTRITATPRAELAANPNVGAAWEFGPAGTTFAQPVTMRLRFPVDAFETGTTASELTLARLENGTWVPRAEGVAVNLTTREVQGQVRSFSTWAVVRDPCIPRQVPFGPMLVSAPLDSNTCRFSTPEVVRWSRYYEFQVTANSTWQWRVGADLPFVFGLKEATTNPAEGTVWGSASGNAGDTVTLRFVLPPARYQLFVSSRDTSDRGRFEFQGSTSPIVALTNGLGCNRATQLVPGAEVRGARLDAGAGDCRSTIQFTPFPDALGKPLVLDFYQARLLAGRPYTITYTLPSRDAYGGAALTVYRNGIVGQDVVDQSRLVRTVQITPPTTGVYLIEVSANGAPATNWELPAPFPYDLTVREGTAAPTARR